MDEQPVTQEKKQTAAYYFVFTLIGAVLLIVLGFIKQSVLPPPTSNQVKIIMVYVSGFSWDRVIPLHKGNKLPFVTRLFREKGSYGDIISNNFDTDAAIVASLFTGRLPRKHGIYKADDFIRFNIHNEFQTPIWQELAVHGQQCMVVGFPFLQKQELSDNIVVAQGNKKSGKVLMTEEHIKRITGGADVPGDLLIVLQECINSDLKRMQQAVKALGARNNVHLFAYFQGLGRWQQRLATKVDSIPDIIRSAFIDNYYIFFDNILAQLFSQCRMNENFMVLSERGNMEGRPTSWNYFPPLNKYPAIGFFYVTGPHIREGTAPLFIGPTDVVPTLLYLTGNPVLNNMDGGVIFRLFEEHYYFKHKLTYK